MAKKAIIIGAGPAGLTAGLELLRRTGIVPIILEASDEIGGISRTIRYKGNRMDIGGHRFFSKSDRVMQWWMDLMPPDLSVPGAPASDTQTAQSKAHGEPLEISYQGKRRVVAVPAHLPEEPPLRGLGPLLGDIDVEGAEPDEDVAETVIVPEPGDPDLGDAHSPAAQPYLLSTQILRLPHHADGETRSRTSASSAWFASEPAICCRASIRSSRRRAWKTS